MKYMILDIVLTDVITGVEFDCKAATQGAT